MSFLDDDNSPVEFVVDELIWGHRLYDEQLPHLIFLEFLGILVANKEKPLIEEPDQQVSYRPQRQMRLRGILFNNPYIEMIADSNNKSDDTKWKEWLEKYASGSPYSEDMSYLKKLFNSFDDFARVVELLRSSAFEVNSNKRWSSKFVFPFGPDALYEDLRIDKKGASNDRRFFARTGEILYLILSRAKRKDELSALLVKRLLDDAMPLNRLVRAIQKETEYAANPKEIGFLPVSSHPRFDQLCADWIHILKQDIPAYDAVQYLIAAAGLNMLLYFLERSFEKTQDSQPLRLLCEIVSKDRTKIRTISSDDYLHNQNLSQRALVAEIEDIKKSQEWLLAASSEYPEQEYLRLVKEKFRWPNSKEEGQNWTDEKLIDRLKEKALSRHSQHVAKVHASWSKSIGLSSRRLSRRTRYAPNDHFLKALVVTVVEQRMPFDDFLAEIYSRYHLVVGEAQGQDLISNNQIDQEALSRNSEYLAKRLSSLGLVRKLSDGCAFVENPFSIHGDSSADK